MYKVVAVSILSALVLVLGSACEPEDQSSAPAPQEKPKQEQPPKKPAKQPVQQPAVKVPDLGVPQLTGDQAKDKKAVQSALVTLKTEWDNNNKLLQEMLKEKRPDAKRVAQLKERNDAFKARAAKLQELLDKLRQ